MTQTAINLIDDLLSSCISARPQVGLGCLILYQDNKDNGKWKFLVSQRKSSDGAGMYQLPGGHLEYGESFQQCASRETKEETNLKINESEWKFCFVSNAKIPAKNINNPDNHYVDIVMATIYKGNINNVKNMEPNKTISGWKWFDFYNHNIPTNQTLCALRSVLLSKDFHPVRYDAYSDLISSDFWIKKIKSETKTETECDNKSNNDNKSKEPPFVTIKNEVYQIKEYGNTSTMNVTSFNGELLPPFISSVGLNWINNNYKTNNFDIFVDTYAKSGTTLTLKLVALILKANNEEIADVDIKNMSCPWDAVPWIEARVSQELFKDNKSVPDKFLKLIENSNKYKQRRLWKSHMSYNNLLQNIGGNDEKIIHCLRNPKSVFCSYFDFFQKEPFVDYRGDIDTLFEWFCDGTVIHSNYWNHEIEWFKISKLNKNVLLILFEDIVKKPVESIEKVAQFLNIELDQQQIEYIKKQISFKKMKQDANKSKGADILMNKGGIARWKNVLTLRQSARIDRITAIKFHDFNIQMTYE
eukprot:556310_1